MSTTDNEFDLAIEDHKNAIAVLKRDIKKHKLLIKQVKVLRKLKDLDKGWVLQIPVKDISRDIQPVTVRSK